MIQIPKLKNYLVVLLMIFALFFITAPVFAAEISLDSKIKEIGVGSQFETAIFLNTESQDINAIEGKLFFSNDLLELKEIRDGNSIINFWIERPKVVNGEIIFSGVIPGGYQETKGFLFSVVFQARASGSGAIEIRDAKVLLNDGKGTEASVKIFPFQFSISQEVSSAPPTVETTKDIDPPEDFKPEVASDPNIFEGKWFLVFATQDKGSGIDGHAVHESRRMKTRIATNEWVGAESPYVLKDQKLRSYIYVKAIDKAGNKKIVVVEPRYPIKWYEAWWIWGIIIIIGVVLAYITRKILWKK